MSKEMFRLYEAGEKTDIYPDFGASVAEATQILLDMHRALKPNEPVSLVQLQKRIPRYSR